MIRTTLTCPHLPRYTGQVFRLDFYEVRPGRDKLIDSAVLFCADCYRETMSKAQTRKEGPT